MKTTLTLLYRGALGTIGVLLALLGFAFLLIPMLGVLLLWAGVVVVTASNWGADEQRTITLPGEAAETTGIMVRMPIAIRTGIGAFGMAVARTASVPAKPRRAQPP